MTANLTEEEQRELAGYQRNLRRVESARKAGIASSKMPNNGRWKKGDSAHVERCKQNASLYTKGRFQKGDSRAVEAGKNGRRKQLEGKT